MNCFELSKPSGIKEWKHYESNGVIIRSFFHVATLTDKDGILSTTQDFIHNTPTKKKKERFYPQHPNQKEKGKNNVHHELL